MSVYELQTYASEIAGQKCKIFCTVMENLIKLLISPGIPFWNRKYSLICTESAGNIIIVVTWAMSNSYIAEKKIPGQSAKSLDGWQVCKPFGLGGFATVDTYILLIYCTQKNKFTIYYFVVTNW